MPGAGGSPKADLSNVSNGWLADLYIKSDCDTWSGRGNFRHGEEAVHINKPPTVDSRARSSFRDQRDFDTSAGVNHSYLFAEWQINEVTNFGINDATTGKPGLDLSNRTFMFGLAFEF